jgi:uncharacterized phage protein (TIGR01671 family)
MREIKFRLWCKNKNEWEKDRWVVEPFGYISEFKTGIEMNPDTHILEQFTGLHDKNGKEIYEADRYMYTPGNKDAEYGEIVYGNGCFWCKRYQDNTDFELYSMVKDIEIVGNIHE